MLSLRNAVLGITFPVINLFFSWPCIIGMVEKYTLRVLTFHFSTFCIPSQYSEDESCFGYATVWLHLNRHLGGIAPGETSVTSALHSALPVSCVMCYKVTHEHSPNHLYL